MPQNYCPVLRPPEPLWLHATNMTTFPTTTPPWPVLWAPALSAMGVFIVGCMAASIAYQQWRTARTKLQLDLLDKRLPIFHAVRDMLLALFNRRPITIANIDEYHSATASASFLFDFEIETLVHFLEYIAKGMEAAAAEPTRYDPIVVAKWQKEVMLWAEQELRTLDILFGPAMTVSPNLVKRLFLPYFRKKLDNLAPLPPFGLGYPTKLLRPEGFPASPWNVRERS